MAKRKYSNRLPGSQTPSKKQSKHGDTRLTKEVERKTSRICIKQLPPTLSTDNQLKNYLKDSQKTYFSDVPCQITDCKVFPRRKIAFVGFSSIETAEACVKYLHRSFYRTTRLVVEFALPPKEKTSQNAASDANKNQNGKEKEIETEKSVVESEGKGKNVDARKEEFLSVMGATSTKQKGGRVWSNDDGITDQSELMLKQKPNSSERDNDSSSSDDDSEGNDSDEDMADPLLGDRSKKKSEESDMDFLRSKTTTVQDFEEDENEDDNSDKGSKATDSEDEVSFRSDEDDQTVPMKDVDRKEVDHCEISENLELEDDNKREKDDNVEGDGTDPKRLFIRNIAFDTTENDLKDHFSKYGAIEDCHLPIDDLGKCKGFAFVTYESSDSAFAARSALDGVDFRGRLIHILQAKKARAEKTSDGSSMSYKDEQDLKRKQQSMKDESGWSASFVRGDAVVDNLARRLGLRKGDILSVKDGMSGGDAAVRLALAETAIIEENRAYFAGHGIDMEALVSFSTRGSEKKQERSKDCLLVKNLPHDTTKEDLMKTFTIPGSDPTHILLPPSKTVAVIQYAHANDAKKAFRKLAYRKFKSVPLYLEYAPTASFTAGELLNKTDESSKELENATDIETPDEIDAADDQGLIFSVYVKNLSFKTTESDLRTFFEKNGYRIRLVRIPKKVIPGKKSSENSVSDSSQQMLSMGYGFVEFASQEDAKSAVKKLQGTTLAGHALEMQLSKASKSERPIHIPTKPPSKIMVRNVPFQATRKELLQLFGSFGQLKRVRLPKKFDGSHRGFAFLEFVSGKEAASAMKALSRTHLYGRHLVLEWAETAPETVDELREKAQRNIAPPKNKKIRF